MASDKAFGVYAAVLVGAVASVITASVAAGVAQIPSAWVFVEHLSMSLLFRGAYKSFGGFGWDDWSVFGGTAADVLETAEPLAQGGATADATS